MASMYYLDGKIVTMGTTKGKAYLNSHPAILATYQAEFLYGTLLCTPYTHAVTCSIIILLSYSYTTEDFVAQSKSATASTSTQVTATTAQVTVTPAQETTTPAKVTKTSAQETTSQAALLLKNSHNVVIATGRKLEGSRIHGHQVHPGCCKVVISDVLISGSKTWFPNQFGEDHLQNGAIVEWPLHHTSGDNVSPLVTRAKRK